MSNAILGFPNWADAGTLSGGGWASSPLTKMQTEPLSEMARSTSATTANAQFDCDFGGPRISRAVCLAAHNISKAGKLKLRASNSVDFGLLAPVSPDISKTPWSNGGSPTVTAVTGPDGEASGWSINDDQAGSTEYRIITLATSGASGATKSLGVWVKKGTATVSAIQVRDTTAPANRLLATITWTTDPDTGASTSPGTPAVTFGGTYVAKQKGDDGLWWYLTFTTAAITSASTNQLWLYGASSSVATTGTTFYAFPGYCTRNLVTSSDISGGSWTDENTPTVSVTTGPFGAQDGYTIYDNNAGTTESRYQTVTYASAGQKALNVWVKKGSAAAANIQLLDITAAASRIYATVTWVGTTPGTPVMTAGTYVSQTAGDNGWYLLHFLSATVTATNTNRLHLRPTTETITNTGSTAYALPWTEDATVAYEDRYTSGWSYAYPQIYEGPSNLLASNVAIDAWGSINTPIVCSGHSDPLGGQRAYLLEDNDAATTEMSYYAPVPFLSDGTKTIAIYVKAGSLTAAGITLYDGTVDAHRHYVGITFSSAGVPTLATLGGAGTLNAVETTSTPGWYRISFTATGVVSAHTNTIYIYPHDGVVATVGTFYVFQPWAEDASSLATATLTTGELGYTDNRLPQAEIDDDFGNPWVHVAPSNVIAQYWRCEIDDTANTDAYIEIGRLMIVQGHEAEINVSVGLNWGWTTTTTRTELDGGDDYVNERPRRRENSFAFSVMSKAEAMRQQDLVRRCGMHKQMLWILDPDGTTYRDREAFPARLGDLPKMQTPSHLWHSAAYTVREVI